MNIENFKQAFTKVVRDINTRNPKWKEDCVGRTEWMLRDYLVIELERRNLLFFNLKIERIGQSIIRATLKYQDNLFSMKKECILEERVLSPRQICNRLISFTESALIEKTNRGLKGKVVGLWRNL